MSPARDPDFDPRPDTETFAAIQTDNGPVAEDLPSPATELFPVGSVRVPWWFHLRVLRGEVTREANGVGPRRMLLRDASGVLVIVALIAFVGAQLTTSPASGGGDASPVYVTGGSSVPLATGTLDLWTTTPEVSPVPTKAQRVVVTKSTVPPWCADPQCTHFATPSPSPSPSPKPSTSPSPAASGGTPSPAPSHTPTATP